MTRGGAGNRYEAKLVNGICEDRRKQAYYTQPNLSPIALLIDIIVKLWVDLVVLS
jgi:hypothetical protein